MTSNSALHHDVVYAHEVMQSAIAAMREFSSDYVPPMLEFPVSDIEWMVSGVTTDELLATPKIAAWLSETLNALPTPLFDAFLETSSVVAQVLAMFGVTEEGAVPDAFMSAMRDPDTLELMLALGKMEQTIRETKGAEEPSKSTDPLGFKKVAMNELRRRGLARQAPYARTLMTLLGTESLMWLTRQSRRGTGNLQPHEFSRTEWHRIWDIENQLGIERELLGALPADGQHIPKVLVAAAWTLVALATFIPPAVFLGERTSHFTSQRRGGKYSIAHGLGSHTLITLRSDTMVSMTEILAEGLTTSLLSAPDLMWIGAALALPRGLQVRHTKPLPITDEKYAIFLSHRGCDAKRDLTKALRDLPTHHGVFLDCTTLPRGVINRSFVFGSLAHSARVVIVDTPNFSASEWCRKEAWLAEAMAKRGLLQKDRLALDGALSLIRSVGPKSRQQRAYLGHEYPIPGRVMRDIDYWARVPNLHSLKEGGHRTDSLTSLRTLVEQEAKPDNADWVRAVGATVAKTLLAVFEECPDATPIDLWATALQLSIAAFGSTSNARSKDEVRHGIDQLNTFLESIVAARLHAGTEFRNRPAAYLSVIAAAVVIGLAGYEVDPRMAPAIREAVHGAAAMHDGLLLLDARTRGAVRDFRLKLAAALVNANIGGVGILQDATDEVHHLYVGDMPLEVLPCVTLHQGMEPPEGFDA